MIRRDGYARVTPLSGFTAPGAAIDVYLPGTTTHATIFADNNTPPTALSNPFQADSNGYYFYYAEGRFDEHVSGTGVATAYTLSDQSASDTLQGRGIFNVKASPYNAIGNGTADDTNPVQAAIDAASVSGGIVYFPPGTYKFTNQLSCSSSNVRFAGEGRAVSVLSWTDTATKGLLVAGSPMGVNTTLAANAQVGDRSVTVTSAAGLAAGAWAYLEDRGANTTALLTRIHGINGTTITLEDALPGPLTTAASAKIYSYAGLLDGIEVKDLTFQSDALESTASKLTLLQLGRCVNPRISNCAFNGSVGPLVTQATCRGGLVTGCDFQNALTVAGSAIETQTSTGMAIVHNYVRACQFGIVFSRSPYCRTEGNTINGRQTRVNLGRGIKYATSSNFGSIVGNTISDPNLFGIFLEDASYCAVTGNTVSFTGSETLTGQHGIQVGGEETGAVFWQYNTISGNTVVGASGYGVAINVPNNGVSTHCTVVGNTLVDNRWGAIVCNGSHNSIAGNTCRSGVSTIGGIIRVTFNGAFNTIVGNVITASNGSPNAINTGGGAGFNQVVGNVAGALALTLHADDLLGATTADVRAVVKPKAPAVSVTAVATGANRNETDLWSVTIPANTFTADGQGFCATAHIDQPVNDNTAKTIRCYLDSTELHNSGAPNGAIQAFTWGMRLSSTTIFLRVLLLHNGGVLRNAATVVPSQSAQDITFKITGQNATATANELKFCYGVLEWIGVPADAFS